LEVPFEPELIGPTNGNYKGTTEIGKSNFLFI